MARTVAVTGVGGLVGRRLVESLLDRDDTERVIGLDVAPPADLPSSPRLVLRQADVRDADLHRHLEGADAVVHLAFLMDEPADRELMRSVNVDGSRNVIESAVRAGVRTVVYVSSVVAYGAHPDNDLPLTEESPLRANPDFAYAEHKREVELWLRSWGEQHPDVTVTVLRPSMIGGQGVDNFFIRQFFSSPRFLKVKGYAPPVQFVHVDDVVSALELALVNDLPGAYNVGSEGWVSSDEFLQLTDQRTLEIPEAAVFGLAERLWRYDLAAGPPGAVHHLMHPWVMSVDRLRAAGWHPGHTNRDCVRELHAEHAPYVALAHDVRVSRRSLRRAAVTSGAVLAVLALGALVGREGKGRGSDSGDRGGRGRRGSDSGDRG